VKYVLLNVPPVFLSQVVYKKAAAGRKPVIYYVLIKLHTFKISYIICV